MLTIIMLIFFVLVIDTLILLSISLTLGQGVRYLQGINKAITAMFDRANKNLLKVKAQQNAQHSERGNVLDMATKAQQETVYRYARQGWLFKQFSKDGTIALNKQVNGPTDIIEEVLLIDKEGKVRNG